MSLDHPEAPAPTPLTRGTSPPRPDSKSLRDRLLEPVRHRLSTVSLWPAIEGLCAVAVLAWCLSEYQRGGILLRGCQIFLMACCVALLISVARWFQLAWSLDWSGPLESIHDTLVQLRAWRARQLHWILTLSAPILIGGALLVSSQAWASKKSQPHDFDTVSNSLQLVLAVMGAFQMRKLGDFTNPALLNQPWCKRLLDGGSVTAIEGAVAEWKYCQDRSQDAPSVHLDAIPNPTDKASPAPSRPDAAQEIR